MKSERDHGPSRAGRSGGPCRRHGRQLLLSATCGGKERRQGASETAERETGPPKPFPQPFPSLGLGLGRWCAPPKVEQRQLRSELRSEKDQGWLAYHTDSLSLISSSGSLLRFRFERRSARRPAHHWRGAIYIYRVSQRAERITSEAPTEFYNRQRK